MGEGVSGGKRVVCSRCVVHMRGGLGLLERDCDGGGKDGGEKSVVGGWKCVCGGVEGWERGVAWTIGTWKLTDASLTV